MDKFLYALWDTKQETIVGQPWLDNRDGAAVRNFHEMCANPQLLVGAHPKDFELWSLAKISIDTRNVTPQERYITSGAVWLDLYAPGNPRSNNESEPPLRAS